MKIYGFWNNKGGTGKTSLSFQTATAYAHAHPEEKILMIDVCPQANLSELLLGGLVNGGSTRLLEIQGGRVRATIGGYFQVRLPSPYSPPVFDARDFITRPSEFNETVPTNIELLAGDPLLELQANAISTLANNQIPGTNTWIAVIDWLRDFLHGVEGDYNMIFVDANPSFSIYTQIALSTVELLVLPVMADDSSRRAIQNAFSLIYGLKLPSDVYLAYAFATKLRDAGRSLPTVHSIVKNRLTQYMGPSSAYASVLRSIDRDVQQLIATNPEIFDFANVDDGMVDIRDFQTTGVVAFARGCPFYALRSGRLEVEGQRIQVNESYRVDCVTAVEGLAARL